jgi:hypothetical protein
MHTSRTKGGDFPRYRPASTGCILQRRKSTRNDKHAHSGKLRFCTGLDSMPFALYMPVLSKSYFSTNGLALGIQTYLCTLISALQNINVVVRSLFALLINHLTYMVCSIFLELLFLWLALFFLEYFTCLNKLGTRSTNASKK